MTSVAQAHQALTRAEATIREAEQARDEARERLDEALEARGWRRMGSCGENTYEDLRSGNARDLATILVIEQQAA